MTDARAQLTDLLAPYEHIDRALSAGYVILVPLPLLQALAAEAAPRPEGLDFDDEDWALIEDGLTRTGVLGTTMAKVRAARARLSATSPAAPRPEGLTRERLAEIVSDSLAATTEGTDYAEAPEPSDEPGSPYVLRLTNEILARLG